MLNPTTFREIVSGQRRGILAGVTRGMLSLGEFPYSWAMRRRNGRYESGQSDVHQVGVPVVSVGNLSLGGTGKTPLVEWIARYFCEQEMRVTGLDRTWAGGCGLCRADRVRHETGEFPQLGAAAL